MRVQDDMQDIEGNRTRSETPKRLFDDENAPPRFSSPRPMSPSHPTSPPRPPSPPPSPPRPPSPPSSPRLSPAPLDFDESPNNSGRNTPRDDNDDNDDNDNDSDNDNGYPPCHLSDMATSVEFIRMVKEATLEFQFGVEELAALCDPRENTSILEDDPYLKFSIRNFISLFGCAQDRYEDVRQNYLDLHPNAPVLSYDQVKRRLRNITGIVTWQHDMYVNTCVVFTGPFKDLESCPNLKCAEPVIVFIVW